MNREQAKILVPIIQALAEGKTVQHRPWGGTWEDVQEINVGFAIANPQRYRIKPEPRRFTVMVPKPENLHYHVELPYVRYRSEEFNPKYWEAVEVVEC